MIDREMFRKWSLTRGELAEFYQSEQEKTPFPWLDEIRSILRETYGARVMTALYDFSFHMHQITFCVYADEDVQKLPFDIPSLKKPKIRDAQIKALIAEHLCPKRYEKTTFCAEVFRSWALVYLWGRIEAVSGQIAAEFASCGFCRVIVPARGVTAFVFPEKKQAGDFVLNTALREHIQKRIFKLVKPYDDYGILERYDQIEIMAEYQGHYWGNSHYPEWIEDIEPEAYMKTLLTDTR